MITRVRVNYNLFDIFRAIYSDKNDYRSQLLRFLKSYFEEDKILLTPSGRGGLYLLLSSLEQNHTVIPAYTCKAVAEAALLAGKDITYIDSDKNGFNMSLASLKDSLQENSIVIATHQFGFPCEIDEIVQLCHKKKCFVIEDSAASLGTKVNGRFTGKFGDAAFFSFDSTKLIQVPMKGGFIIVRDEDLWSKVQRISSDELRPIPSIHKCKLLALAFIMNIIDNPYLYRLFHTLYFRTRGKYTEDSPLLDTSKGPFYTYTLSNWQAAFAFNQLKRVNAIIKVRQDLYAYYLESLSEASAFELPPEDKNREWACIRFPIRVKGDKMSFYLKAASKGVDFAFSFTYPPCPDSFVNARSLANSVLDIPYYNMLSNQEQEKVVAVLKSIN